ncbi:MAG TPA: TetR family transcriptional regulator, partial [Flavisolibacter sp.]|nr:TetR family transcriptional regulator [Flavisolibacter sp.]
MKQEHIVEAAIRRFSHFGIAKTTMTEIADDLSLSKQSLFYYFPDKQSLVLAVREKLTENYLAVL